MTAIVPMDMLEEIQGWAPAGGFVRSQWLNGAMLEPGHLMRRNGWAVITAAGEAVTRNGRGEVIDRSPAIAWRDREGNSGTRILFGPDGAEVRTDTRIDPASIPAPEPAKLARQQKEKKDSKFLASPERFRSLRTGAFRCPLRGARRSGTDIEARRERGG